MSGCQKISPGCKNCYAERIFSVYNKGKIFTDVQYHESRFEYPFPEQPARMIFVGSMSDIMLAPFPFIRRVFDTICQDRYSQHTFQMLTKRPEVMIEFDCNHVANMNYSKIWFGVSTENQDYAEKRIPALLQTVFNNRWVSCEPLLDRIDLSTYISQLSWVVAGGESGPHARPMHPDWVRLLRDTCMQHSVPFFFKSWGEWIPLDQIGDVAKTSSVTRLDYDNKTRYIKLGVSHTGRLLDGQEWNQFPRVT
jgi:protein gp37